MMFSSSLERGSGVTREEVSVLPQPYHQYYLDNPDDNCHYVISSESVTSRRTYLWPTDIRTVTTPLSNYKIIGNGRFDWYLRVKRRVPEPISRKMTIMFRILL